MNRTPILATVQSWNVGHYRLASKALIAGGYLSRLVRAVAVALPRGLGAKWPRAKCCDAIISQRGNFPCPEMVPKCVKDVAC